MSQIIFADTINAANWNELLKLKPQNSQDQPSLLIKNPLLGTHGEPETCLNGFFRDLVRNGYRIAQVQCLDQNPYPSNQREKDKKLTSVQFVFDDDPQTQDQADLWRKLKSFYGDKPVPCVLAWTETDLKNGSSQLSILVTTTNDSSSVPVYLHYDEGEIFTNYDST